MMSPRRAARPADHIAPAAASRYNTPFDQSAGSFYAVETANKWNRAWGLIVPRVLPGRHYRIGLWIKTAVNTVVRDVMGAR